MRKKTAYVYAILKEKRTVTFHNERYNLNVPKIVDKKTARLLKETGLFKFEKVSDENQGSNQKRQEENKKENSYKGEFYTKIPNKILQPLLMIKLQSYEIRIFLAIARKTYGFNKDRNHINQNQLKKLTVIKQPHISRTLKSLLEKRMIIKKGKDLAIQKDYKLWKISEKKTLKNIPDEV